MPLNKELSRIEAKLDALLDKMNVEYKEPTAKPATPRKLSAAEQQAIDNAPATPVGASGPAEAMPRADATTNAPHGMGGRTPGDGKPKSKKSGQDVNWDS